MEIHKPLIIALDLEGTLIPEIWISIAEKTGIEKLKLTTRDIPNYDELMQKRLKLLSEHKITLPFIQDVIKTLNPLKGAVTFLEWIQRRPATQAIVVSDTFYEFALPLMKKLYFPLLFSNSLEVNSEMMIVNYHMRLNDQKRNVVQAFKNIGFLVIAIGDSYNDIPMLQTAHEGIFFNAPKRIVGEYPEFPLCTRYEELKERIVRASEAFSS